MPGAVADSEVLVNFCFTRGWDFSFLGFFEQVVAGWQHLTSQRPKFAKIVFWVTCQKLKFAVHTTAFFHSFTTEDVFAKLRNPFECEEA
jgi:hypothetical protein